MKSTQQQLSPTDCVVTLVDTVPLSFVATNAKEIVFEVKMVGTGKRQTAQKKKGEGRIPQLVARVELIQVNQSQRDEHLESLEIDTAENGHLRISTAFHNRWVWLGFQLLTVACVLISGHITLSI